MMKQAKERNPFCSLEHEQKVKDIREGKFKILVPAVALTFKYLCSMFEVIKKTMEDAVMNKNKSSFK